MKQEADAIFTGIVKSVTQETLSTYKIVITAKKSWKAKEVKDYVIYTSGGCYVGFAVGKTYLVYAKNNEDKQLFTNICWGTGSIELSGKDMKILGKPTFINFD
jgi:hypothetical protein